MKEDATIGQRDVKKEGNIENAVQRIQRLFISFAESYLPEGDPLRDFVVSYYSDTERITSELGNVFAGLGEDQIEKKMMSAERAFSDKDYFIEYFEKRQEKNLAKERNKLRASESPVADDAEYDAGTYREGIERQVVDAVFELRAKGYDTFQSGFTEGEARSQFLDVYNKKVSVPTEITEYLSDVGFRIEVHQDGGRTTIMLSPVDEAAVRLDQWKEVWDSFANRMPSAELEDLSDARIYDQRVDFQRIQDNLRLQRQGKQ